MQEGNLLAGKREALRKQDIKRPARRKQSCRFREYIPKVGHIIDMQEGKHLAGKEDARQKKSFKTAEKQHKRTETVLPPHEKNRYKTGFLNLCSRMRILQCYFVRILKISIISLLCMVSITLPGKSLL